MTNVAIGAVAAAPHGTPPEQSRDRRRLLPYLLLLPGLLWLVVFFIAPLVQLFSVSLQSPFPGFPGYYYRDVNFANYANALVDFAPQFGRSLLYASIATALAFAIGYPLAYAIAFKAGRWRNLMLIAVVAPFFTSFILRTIAWRQILADDSPITRTLTALHITPSGHLTETWVAVVAGITYNFIPFMTLPIYASLERVDPRLVEAGSDLYGNGFTTFRKVTFPLSMPGVVAGTLLTFIPAAGDYVNAELLGSDVSTKMVGNGIESQFFRVLGGFPTAAALSFMLMAGILALVFLYARRAGTENLL